MKKLLIMMLCALVLFSVFAQPSEAIADWNWNRNTTYTVGDAGVKNASFLCILGVCIDDWSDVNVTGAGGGDITGVNTPVPNDYIYNGSQNGEVYLRFNETKLNDTIDSRSSGGGSQWTITSELQNQSGSLGVNDTWLNDSIDARQVDTNVTTACPSGNTLLEADGDCIATPVDTQISLSTIIANIGNWSADMSSYYTSTVIDSIIGGLVNLTLSDVVANVGNWSADKSSYTTGAHTVARTDEEIEDLAGAMTTGNTETLISVDYQDGDGTIDYAVTSTLSSYTDDLGHVEESTSAGLGLVLTGYMLNISSGDCSDEANTLSWSPTTGFGCNADAGAGGGMTSWTISNGSVTNAITDGERVNITAGENVTITQSGADLVINSFYVDTDTTYSALSEFSDDLGHVEDNTSWNETYANTLYSTGAHTTDTNSGGNMSIFTVTANGNTSSILNATTLHFKNGTGTIASLVSGGGNTNISFSLNNTGVTAATYGSNIATSVIGISAQGRVTSAVTTTIRTGTTSQTGVLQLTNSNTSTSTTTAVTPNAVDQLRSFIFGRMLNTTTTFGGEVSGTYGALVVGNDVLDDQYVELLDTFGGDVSGTYDAIVVTDDSHNHVYSNIDAFTEANLYSILSDVSDFLQSLADDPSPQLGGVLDTNGYNITVATNVNITMGSGRIYHNGSGIVFE